MIAHEPHGERSYVPLETYIELSRALEALQATCREYQADAHAAMQYAAELRAALAGMMGVEAVFAALERCSFCRGTAHNDHDGIAHSSDCPIAIARALLAEGTGAQGGEA